MYCHQIIVEEDRVKQELGDEKIQSYLEKVTEKCFDLYTKDNLPNVKTLIVLGSGELKEKISNYLGLLNSIKRIITIDNTKTIHELRPQINEIINSESDITKKKVKQFLTLFEKMDKRVMYGLEEIISRQDNLSYIILHNDSKELQKDLDHEYIYVTSSEKVRQLGGICGELYF